MVDHSGRQLEPVSARKAALRRVLAARRAARPAAERAAAAERIAETALGHPLLQAAHTVAAYVGVGVEPGTEPLLDGLVAAGVRVVLPIVDPARQLGWAAYEGAAALGSGAYALREPTGARVEAALATGAGVRLIPALAVDLRGHRLGRGGGYYDRFLASVRPAGPTLAVVYDDEVLAEVPVEPHDAPVAGWLTPSALKLVGEEAG